MSPAAMVRSQSDIVTFNADGNSICCSLMKSENMLSGCRHDWRKMRCNIFAFCAKFYRFHKYDKQHTLTRTSYVYYKAKKKEEIYVNMYYVVFVCINSMAIFVCSAYCKMDEFCMVSKKGDGDDEFPNASNVCCGVLRDISVCRPARDCLQALFPVCGVFGVRFFFSSVTRQRACIHIITSTMGSVASV